MYYNNNNYEDYMRGVLGYNNNINSNFNTYPMYYEYDNNQDVDCESMYPEIYHQINPIVESCCSRYQNTRITKEVIEEITEQVFTQYSQSRGLENTTSEISKTANSSSSTNSSSTRKDDETRSPRNNLLRDLIRILIIRNLFRNRPRRLYQRGNMGPGISQMGWQGMPSRPGPSIPPQYQPRYY